MNLNEQYQLRKIRRGDLDSFEKLFHKYYNGMKGYAESLVRKSEVAEEVVQDVFYNIWKNRDSLRINRSWHSYLFRSVFNNSMMYLRKARIEFPLEESSVPEPFEWDNDPSQLMQTGELSEVISRSLRRLPDRTREIFLLNRREGMKYREIADRLSISVKTVEAHMGRALKDLRESLKKYEQ
jgi:RNA polymerase sigma-70 factor (ECF subfamily)